MDSYRAGRFVSSDFRVHKHATNKVWSSERCERTIIWASPSHHRNAARTLRSERESHSMLRELVSRFRQPRALVVYVFTGIFSAESLCLTASCHRVFVGCKPDLKCFCRLEVVLLRQSRKAALNTATDVTSREEEADAPDIEAGWCRRWWGLGCCALCQIDCCFTTAPVQAFWLFLAHFSRTRSLLA